MKTIAAIQKTAEEEKRTCSTKLPSRQTAKPRLKH